MSTPLHSRLTYYPDKVSIRGIAFYERTAEAACLGNGLPRPDMLTLRKLEESDPYQMTPEMRAATAACSRASHRWLNCPTCCLSSRPPSPWCRSRDESVLGRRMSSPSTGKASACRGNHRTSAWCSAADGPKQDLKIESLEKQRGVAVRYLNTVYEAMFGRSKSRMEGCVYEQECARKEILKRETRDKDRRSRVPTLNPYPATSNKKRPRADG